MRHTIMFWRLISRYTIWLLVAANLFFLLVVNMRSLTSSVAGLLHMRRTNDDTRLAPGARDVQDNKQQESEIIAIYPWYKRHRTDTVPLWYGGEGPAAFEKCSEARCTIVNDSQSSDAVLIAHNFLTSYHTNITLPTRPGPHQKWVFFSWETPQHFDIRPEFLHLFNATFTYMAKSDAHYPYGKVLPLEKPVQVSYEDKNWDKKKNAVWMVSHCITPGGREEYIQELTKHIDIKVYGGCASYFDPGDKNPRYSLQDKFKFYMAFENTLCREYATEKVFQTLKTRMIPVVYGLYDYKNNLPPKSYIDVRDFKSPKHLADYLKLLAGNKTLFDEYLMWKQHYMVTQHVFPEATCQLCEHLHRTRHDPPHTVPLEEFWSRNDNCIEKEGFLHQLGFR